VFLLSFITDLWTPRNVALIILTPQSKMVSARHGHCRRVQCASGWIYFAWQAKSTFIRK